MADPTPTPSNTPASSAGQGAGDPGKEAQQGGARARQTVESERRTFAAGVDAARQTGDQAISAGQDMARRGAEAGRDLAQSGRVAGREAADLWRGAMEPFIAMQMDMNRWFEDLWRQTTGMSALPGFRTPRAFSAGAAGLFGLPATDVKETDGAYLLSVELPGLVREDVDLAVAGDLLTVSGHKAEASSDKGGAYRVSERRFGRFERSFPIPPDVDRAKIGAAFRNGVLEIDLPKSEAAARRSEKIEIKG
jgi:HSP20 family protein